MEQFILQTNCIQLASLIIITSTNQEFRTHLNFRLVFIVAERIGLLQHCTVFINKRDEHHHGCARIKSTEYGVETM